MPVKPFSQIPLSNNDPSSADTLVGVRNSDTTDVRFSVGQILDTLPPVSGRTVLTGQGPTTFYVDNAGGGGGNGTQGDPWHDLGVAAFEIAQNYDLGANGVVVQLVGSPHASGFFLGNQIVGGSSAPGGSPPVGNAITILGDKANPASFVIDGTTGFGNGLFIGPGVATWVHVEGITFENFSGSIFPISNNGGGSVISIGNVIFNNNSTACIGSEGGSIISGSFLYGGGTPPNITFTGTNGQAAYIAFDGSMDPNDANWVFTGSTFSDFVFNIANHGHIRWWNYFTGTPTGQKFTIDTGGVIIAADNLGGALINASSMPGTVAGQIIGGYFNESNTPNLTFAELPSGTSLEFGYVAAISDGATGNCADGTCTTFGTQVTGGGGSLKLLVWWNGTNWNLIGK